MHGNDNSVDDAPRYWAYLSYSHADERQAAKLHRQIEAFRVPDKIVGRSVNGLVAGRHLRPVFRDRDELSSASDLSSSLDDALRRSSALIVLCTPAAVQSRWVGQEIRRFVALHGAGRVFPLILKGTPGSGDAQECFPEALRDCGIEPIAGDLRKSGDGRRDGLLKVIAGLLEVPFDSLKRREAQRRQRRLVAVAAGTTAAAVAASLLAVFAFQQRADAVQQRQLAEQRRGQAEDLISFMLGDLRQRLQAVGRLDVLEAVGEKAETYFESLPASELTDATLASQARALRQIGEIRIQQGSYPDAQQAFLVALEQAAELQQRHPEAADFLFELSQAQYWVGYSHYLGGDLARAGHYFEEYRRSAAKLVERAPDNVDFRIELAYAYSNLGTVAYAGHQVDAALAAFQRCQELFQDLHLAAPDDADLLFELAATDSWLGRVHEARYDFRSALDYRQRSADAHARVADLTGHAFHRQMMAESLSNLAGISFDLGRVAEAARHEAAAVAVYRELVAHDDANLDWRLRSYLHLSELAWLERFAGSPQSAVADLDELLREARALGDTDPGNADWQSLVGGVAARVVFIKLLDGDYDRADGVMTAHVGAPMTVADVEHAPVEVVARRLRFALAESLLHRARGRPAQAIEVAAATLRLLSAQPLRAVLHHEEMALLHRAAGQAAEALALQTVLTAGGFAAPDFAELLALFDAIDGSTSSARAGRGSETSQVRAGSR